MRRGPLRIIDLPGELDQREGGPVWFGVSRDRWKVFIVLLAGWWEAGPSDVVVGPWCTDGRPAVIIYAPLLRGGVGLDADAGCAALGGADKVADNVSR